ncbi:MAG TPA: hypothetical protein VGR62_12970 [Candidatus Binatia bacterium]|jgi:hypothetical protein|nr:hypothetical protein [Candidatus Binatia bacterium]
MRRVLALLVLVAAMTAVVPSGADVITEQTVTAIPQTEEQQVVAIAQPQEQDVQAMDVSGVQIVGPNIPPTEADRTASAAGKIVLGVASAALSLGATAAMLMFL